VSDIAREGAEDCGDVDDAKERLRVFDMKDLGSIGIGLSGWDVDETGIDVCRWVAMLKACTECLRIVCEAREKCQSGLP